MATFSLIVDAFEKQKVRVTAATATLLADALDDEGIECDETRAMAAVVGFIVARSGQFPGERRKERKPKN